MSAKNDVGLVGLYAPIAVPGAPTATVNATSGNLTGAYTYAVCFLTGYWQGATGSGTLHTQGNTGIGTSSVAISPSGQQASIASIPIGGTGVVARVLCRTKANGSIFYVLAQISDNLTTSWTDNVADSALTVLAATANTTGTFPQLTNLATFPPVGLLNTICIVNGRFYQSNGVAWIAMPPALHASSHASGGADVVTPESIGAWDIGSSNASTQQVMMLPIDTDTRTINVSRTSGKISSMTLTDPNNSNATVETVTVNRSSGLISSLVKTVGARTITYTVNRSSGQITSITKVVA